MEIRRKIYSLVTLIVALLFLSAPMLYQDEHGVFYLPNPDPKPYFTPTPKVEIKGDDATPTPSPSPKIPSNMVQERYSPVRMLLSWVNILVIDLEGVLLMLVM